MEQSGSWRITHTPVNVVIDSCHMSIPARRWHDERWPTEGSRGLQSWRVPSEVKNKAHNIHQSTLSTYHLTDIDSILMQYLSFNYYSLICLLLWDTCLFMSTSAIFVKVKIRREWGMNCRALVMAECVFDSTSWWETNLIYSHYMQSCDLQASASSLVMIAFPCGM